MLTPTSSWYDTVVKSLRLFIWSQEDICVSFQDHETSFPRALSAQRLSPRWCFLDGECFYISWSGGMVEAAGQCVDGWSGWALVFQGIIQKPFTWPYRVGICIPNDVLPHTFLKSFFSKKIGELGLNFTAPNFPLSAPPSPAFFQKHVECLS